MSLQATAERRLVILWTGNEYIFCPTKWWLHFFYRYYHPKLFCSKKWCAKSSQYEQHVASVLVLPGKGLGWWIRQGADGFGQLSLAVAGILNKQQPVGITTLNNPSTWVFLRLTCCGYIFFCPFVASIPGVRAESPSMMEATCGRRCDFLWLLGGCIPTNIFSIAC